VSVSGERWASSVQVVARKEISEAWPRFFLQTASNKNSALGIISFSVTATVAHGGLEPMGLGKTWSVVVHFGRAGAASAGSMLLSTTTRTRTCGRPSPSPGVLYVDRGVIVLNKPPGLVSQGTSESSAAVAVKNRRPETALSRTAFDDVLNGTVQTLILLRFQGERSQR
jgi:hypothetical protein